MDVLLAVVPFADVERPAIGVSLLKAEVARAGFTCAVEYLNFGLAETISKDLYTAISENIPSESLVGEWFFADVIFGDELPHEQEYLNRILSRHASPNLVSQIQWARRERHAFVERAAQTLQARRARIVGFSSTFHQTCCALAIAKRLKALPDPPLIVFGGANCEGEMGLQLLRAFPWIDYVCTREGDIAFPAFVQRCLRDGNADPVPGILRQGVSTEVTTPELVGDLDALPYPDYDDYIARLEASSVRADIRPELLFETARGCWWGAKSHCTFCGLNGDTMPFRSKSWTRAFAEVEHLYRSYGISKIDCVDNILDMKYIDTLFPKLRDSGMGIEIFYEVKSNLRQPQIAMLRAGGVKTIQPGIESFSNEVLRRMRKGCTGLQNIQLLRWCEEVGITVAWNILAGFPGESPGEYAAMARLLPLLSHLQPPSSCAPVRLDRFSPLFTRAAEFGLRRVRPTSAYYYVYPLGRRELAQLAYFFDFDYADGQRPADYIADVRREVERWLVARSAAPAERPRLDAQIDDAGRITVDDTRACATQPRYELSGTAARVYAACDIAHTVNSLRDLFQDAGTASATDIETTVKRLCEARLMVEMEGRFLSLALFTNRTQLDRALTAPEHVHLQETPTREPLLRTH
jgi:ribosomal peptide maturation radical SAM protein 1